MERYRLCHVRDGGARLPPKVFLTRNEFNFWFEILKATQWGREAVYVPIAELFELGTPQEEIDDAMAVFMSNGFIDIKDVLTDQADTSLVHR